MNSHVPVKASFSSETYSTPLASIRLLSSVNFDVGFKVSMLTEMLSTLKAG